MDEHPLILVVDDAGELLKMLPVQLEHWGYRVVTAATGEHGLELAKTQRPNVILLDMLLPKMKGREFCQHLKRDAALARIPVIFLTALGHDDYIRNAFEMGAVDYITKPFQPEYLRERIRLCLLRSMPTREGA